MGLFSSVIKLVKKPLDVALKTMTNLTGVGVLTDLVTLAKKVLNNTCGNDTASRTIKTINEDVRLLTMKNNIDKKNKQVDLLTTEGASYISAMTKEFYKMVSDYGISKTELDEFTAVYILDRLNCPPKYAEAIIKTISLKNKIRESGILKDAVEVSKLHVDNIKDSINIARAETSVDYLMAELNDDMKVNKIYTNVGTDVLIDREGKLEDFKNGIKYKNTKKNFNKIIESADTIFDERYRDVVDEYYVKYFENIKNNYDASSEERQFLIGK